MLRFRFLFLFISKWSFKEIGSDTETFKECLELALLFPFHMAHLLLPIRRE